MKEDIIAANISGLRSDIQSLAKQIAAWSRSFAQQATPAPQTQIDEKQLVAAIADLIHTDIKSRLQNDKEFVNTVASAYDRVAKQYSADINTTHNCLKQNNSYLQLTEKRYKELAATDLFLRRWKLFPVSCLSPIRGIGCGESIIAATSVSTCCSVCPSS